MTTATEEPEWISTEEAAKKLGVSTRQIQRLAARGLIKRRYIKPGEGNRYGRTEVQGRKILEMTRERQAAINAPPDELTGVAVTHVARSQASVDLMRQWVEATAALNSIAERRNTPRPWLTLDEAAEFSGLTKTWLAREAETGEGAIATRDMGKHARGGRWRFFRGDLERAE